MTIKEKLNRIATEIYGASEVVFTKKAETSLQAIAALGGDTLPVCVAKTQYSLSDDPTLLAHVRKALKLQLKICVCPMAPDLSLHMQAILRLCPVYQKYRQQTKLMWIITEWFPVYFNDMIRKEVFPCHNF